MVAFSTSFLTLTAERRGHKMVIIFFGIVFAFILYLTVIVPIKMVLLALRMMR